MARLGSYYMFLGQRHGHERPFAIMAASLIQVLTRIMKPRTPGAWRSAVLLGNSYLSCHCGQCRLIRANIMKWTIKCCGKSYEVNRRWRWLTIRADGRIFVFIKKPIPANSVSVWMPSIPLSNPAWRRSAIYIGHTKPPKNWRTEIYRLEHKK